MSVSRYFATSLWEEFELLFKELARITSSVRETMSPDDDTSIARDSELLELVTSCLVCVAQVGELNKRCTSYSSDMLMCAVAVPVAD